MLPSTETRVGNDILIKRQVTNIRIYLYTDVAYQAYYNVINAARAGDIDRPRAFKVQNCLRDGKGLLDNPKAQLRLQYGAIIGYFDSWAFTVKACPFQSAKTVLMGYCRTLTRRAKRLMKFSPMPPSGTFSPSARLEVL